MPVKQTQLKTDVMFAKYKQACKDELTFDEFYSQLIEPEFEITKDSLQSKLSTEKKNLELAATVFEYDGEEKTGQELVEIRDSAGKRIFDNLRDVAKNCEVVEAVDMSVFPTLKGGGSGRGGQSMDRSSILSDLLEA